MVFSPMRTFRPDRIASRTSSSQTKSAGVASVGRPLSGPPEEPDRARPTSTSTQTVLDRYCVTCHNQRARTGGLALDALDLNAVAREAQTWEKVVRKVRTGMMPPSGAPRPDRSALDNLGLIQNFLGGIDEEQEPSYKQESAPRYHAVDTALAVPHKRTTTVAMDVGRITLDGADLVKMTDDMAMRIAGSPAVQHEIEQHGPLRVVVEPGVANLDVSRAVAAAIASVTPYAAPIHAQGDIRSLVCRISPTWLTCD